MLNTKITVTHGLLLKLLKHIRIILAPFEAQQPKVRSIIVSEIELYW